MSAGSWGVTRGLFRRYENDYFQYRNGLFDADTWASYRISFREDTLSAPLLRAVWSIQRDKFNPEFAAEVDQLAEQARAATKQSEWLAFDGQPPAPNRPEFHDVYESPSCGGGAYRGTVALRGLGSELGQIVRSLPVAARTRVVTFSMIA